MMLNGGADPQNLTLLGQIGSEGLVVAVEQDLGDPLSLPAGTFQINDKIFFVVTMYGVTISSSPQITDGTGTLKMAMISGTNVGMYTAWAEVLGIDANGVTTNQGVMMGMGVSSASTAVQKIAQVTMASSWITGALTVKLRGLTGAIQPGTFHMDVYRLRASSSITIKNEGS